MLTLSVYRSAVRMSVMANGWAASKPQGNLHGLGVRCRLPHGDAAAQIRPGHLRHGPGQDLLHQLKTDTRPINVI